MLCSYRQGENHLEFIDSARVICFKGKAVLILEIKDEVYSSSAGTQMNGVTLSSRMQISYCVGLSENKKLDLASSSSGDTRWPVDA